MCLYRFAEERGIDAGGLSREFFTLFFAQCQLLQGGFLIYNPEALQKKLYLYMGRIAAKAILSGSPSLFVNERLAHYILYEELMEIDVLQDISQIEPTAQNFIDEVMQHSKL